MRLGLCVMTSMACDPHDNTVVHNYKTEEQIVHHRSCQVGNFALATGGLRELTEPSQAE